MDRQKKNERDRQERERKQENMTKKQKKKLNPVFRFLVGGGHCGSSGFAWAPPTTRIQVDVSVQLVYCRPPQVNLGITRGRLEDMAISLYQKGFVESRCHDEEYQIGETQLMDLC